MAARMLASSILAAIGVVSYFSGLDDGWLFGCWIVLGIFYHIFFGSGLVIARREEARADVGTTTGRYWTIWKQR